MGAELSVSEKPLPKQQNIIRAIFEISLKRSVGFEILNEKKCQKHIKQLHFTNDNTTVQNELKRNKDYIFLQKRSNGTIKNQLGIPILIGKKCISFMVSSEEIVILQRDYFSGQENVLIEWNFKQETVAFVPLTYLPKLPKMDLKINYFSRRNIICIFCQYQQKQIHKVQLSYYWLPLNGSSQPFHTFVYEKKQEIKVFHLNNDSMVGFITNSSIGPKTLKFDVYQIKKQGDQGQLLQISKALNFKKQSFFLYQISDLWQINPLQFFIQIRYKIEKKYYLQNLYQKQINPEALGRSCNFFFNYKENSIKQFFFNPLQIHQIQFVNALRTLDSQRFVYKGYYEKKNVPIYYIDGTQIMFRDQPRKYLEKWTAYSMTYLSGHFEQLYRDRYTQEIIIRQTKIPEVWWIHVSGLPIHQYSLYCRLCGNATMTYFTKSTKQSNFDQAEINGQNLSDIHIIFRQFSMFILFLIRNTKFFRCEDCQEIK